MLPVPVELRKRPWTALEGSNLVSLFHRCGCKWPIDGQAEQLFCDLPIHQDNNNGGASVTWLWVWISPGPSQSRLTFCVWRGVRHETYCGRIQADSADA